MKIIRNIRKMQDALGQCHERKLQIGFIPTMGALHEGHLSLVRKARCENDAVIASIFVNPLQFGPKEDLKKYPRPFAKDRRLLAEEKVDYLFYPTPQAVYPRNFSSMVEVDPRLANVLCGKSRPGHFKGVAVVVARLFSIVQPNRAYFGEKDYQQTVVIRRLVHDLGLPIKIKVLPTVRERDGLAMSSRNIYLSAEERKRARVLSQTLFWFRDQIVHVRQPLAILQREAKRRLASQVSKIDYFDVVDPESLASLKKVQPRMAVLTACFVGKTRLIDNVIIQNKKR